MSLGEKDLNILQKFQECLKTNRPLQFIELNKKNKNWSNQYRISIHSEKICNDLFNLNCINKKSLELKFPKGKIPPELLRHFIRGYIDGDGSFVLYQNKKINLGHMVYK